MWGSWAVPVSGLSARYIYLADRAKARYMCNFLHENTRLFSLMKGSCAY
jgi:hypothetical protein